MKYLLLTATITSLVSVPSLASELIEKEANGSRIGLGYSQLSTNGYEVGAGLKLEFAFDINNIVGLSLSYENYKDSWFDVYDLRSIQIGSDIGYTFHYAEGSIKPYFAVGMNMYDESAYTFSYNDTGLYYGIGLRTTIGKHFYVDTSFKTSNLASVDMDYINIMAGYKF